MRTKTPKDELYKLYGLEKKYVPIKDLPLIEKWPSIILTAESRALRRKVREIQQKHPEWGPGPIKHALFQEGLIASREDVEKVMDKVDRYEDMLPLRLVKYRLGLW